jgi:hypothetical protein
VADPSPPFPECLPHYGFWKEVPGWARDGCRLVGGKVLSV